ncbi:MAG: dynamin family protein, partial [Firmicutes bacterium]|nr:dynamin family protein [Bacillota bacterium]
MMNVLETTIEIRDLFSRYELCKVQESQVNKLVEKLQNKEVTIAVIGQFKRGKTTMINSILGNKLLPVGIVPITSAVTSIRYAEDARDTARVLFLNGL